MNISPRGGSSASAQSNVVRSLSGKPLSGPQPLSYAAPVRQQTPLQTPRASAITGAHTPQSIRAIGGTTSALSTTGSLAASSEPPSAAPSTMPSLGNLGQRSLSPPSLLSNSGAKQLLWNPPSQNSSVAQEQAVFIRKQLEEIGDAKKEQSKIDQDDVLSNINSLLSPLLAKVDLMSDRFGQLEAASERQRLAVEQLTVAQTQQQVNAEEQYRAAQNQQEALQQIMAAFEQVALCQKQHLVHAEGHRYTLEKKITETHQQHRDHLEVHKKDILECVRETTEKAFGSLSVSKSPQAIGAVAVTERTEVASSTSLPANNDGVNAASSEQVENRKERRVSLAAQSVKTALSTPLLAESQKDCCGSQGIPSHLSELSKRSSGARMDALFPKVQDLKDSVLNSLRKSQYDVEDLYHTSGKSQEIARNVYFKDMILGVICLNTIWIAIETDNNKADVLWNADLVFIVVDNLFCGIFFFEICVRLASFKNKLNAMRDGWFVFDATLVSLMVWETWIMVLLYVLCGFASAGKDAKASQALRIARLVRLVRVARATRLLQQSPELLILCEGVVLAMRSVLAVLALMGLVIYVFAVIFTMLLSGSGVGQGVFDTVPEAMNHLMLQVLCGADSDFMLSLLNTGWVYYLIFLFFLFGSNLTLMNMLIGILCDVVSDVSSSAKENQFLKEVETQISRLAAAIDSDGSGSISREEFDLIIGDPMMTVTFDELGVDIVGVAHFARFIYDQQIDEITYSDFGNLVGQFRGTKNATVKDVMDVRRYVTTELLSLEHNFQQKIENLEDDVGTPEKRRSE